MHIVRRHSHDLVVAGGAVEGHDQVARVNRINANAANGSTTEVALSAPVTVLLKVKTTAYRVRPVRHSIPRSPVSGRSMSKVLRSRAHVVCQ